MRGTHVAETALSKDVPRVLARRPLYDGEGQRVGTITAYRQASPAIKEGYVLQAHGLDGSISYCRVGLTETELRVRCLEATLEPLPADVLEGMGR